MGLYQVQEVGALCVSSCKHLQDLGVDEAYLNKARHTYANRLAKAQNSD